MIRRLPRTVALLLLACMPFTIAADGPTPAPSPPPVPVTPPAPNQNPPGFRELATPSSNKVGGLELPPNQEVSSKKRFVVITAKSDGPVR